MLNKKKKEGILQHANTFSVTLGTSFHSCQEMRYQTIISFHTELGKSRIGRSMDLCGELLTPIELADIIIFYYLQVYIPGLQWLIHFFSISCYFLISLSTSKLKDRALWNNTILPLRVFKQEIR